MAALVPTRRARSARPPRTMPRRPEQTLRLFGSRTQLLWIVALVVVWVMLPNLLTDFWLDVLARCGLAAVGAIGLRLRGDYLAIVTIGLLYVGEYIFSNWDSVTGGHAGTATDAPVSIGPINFAHLHAFGQIYTRRQGMVASEEA